MTWIPRATRERIGAVATTLALACGGDDEGPVGNAGSIQLTVDRSSLALPQGATGTVTAVLTRNGGFAGDVTLAINGLPTGIASTITPTPLSGTTTTATVTVIAAATVEPQTYAATITATAPGVGQATASLTIGVTPASTGSTTIEYQYCDVDAAPVFFAYQSGSGAWQPVTGVTSPGAKTFTFTLNQERGGVLAVFATASAGAERPPSVSRPPLKSPTPSRIRDRALALADMAAGRVQTLAQSLLAETYATQILYASAAELAQDGAGNCAVSGQPKTVTGTVAGIAGGQYGIVSLGGVNALFVGGTSTNPVTFTDVPGGPIDLVGTRLTTPGAPPDKLILRRNLNIADGGSLSPAIDFSTAASAPATATVTTTGGSGDDLEVFTEFVTANGRSLMWFDLAPNTSATRTWAGVPSSAMVAGDLHTVVVFATPRGSDDFRVSLAYVAPVANHSLTLGPSINAPTISQIAGGNYPRFRFQGALPSAYNKGASLDLANNADGNTFSIIATGAYLTGAGSALAYDFTMPDVAGLTGFPVAARLTKGATGALATGFGFTGPGIFDLQPNLGSEYKAATKSVTIVVP